VRPSDAHPGDPIALFSAAFQRASEIEPFDPSAMTLATVGEGGRPAARMVLLKGVDDRGFLFYTNYRSRKARELEQVPAAALCVHWPRSEQQVRVEGDVEKVSAAESDGYFATRARGSQIGAWASDQSEELEDRASLERRAGEIAAQYEGGDIPRPPHWGGYVLRPRLVEFWYGRPDRLHERHVYDRTAVGAPWRYRVLSP
jgi:pyridoxamine 5'-phosphate oxidase